MSSRYLEQLLVDSEKEQEYCEAHGIIFRRLANGIRLVSVNRNIKDSVFTASHFQFNAGSWFDPAGKKGTHHLLEHFFNQPIRSHAAYYDCEVNAYTSSLKLGEYLGGPANLQFKDFGIWQVIDHVCDVLKDPFKRHSDLERFFRNEKSVVLAEHANNMASHDWHVSNTMFSWLFDSRNPISDYPLGDPDSLMSITLEDLYAAMEHTLVPKNAVISTVTDSNYTTSLEITDMIQANVEQFPRELASKTPTPTKAMKLFNTSVKPGEIYHFDHGIKNGQVTLIIGWKSEFPQYSSRDFSFSRIIEEFGQKAFEFARDNGWSYNINSNFINPSTETGAFYIVVDLPSSKDLTEKKIQSFVDQLVPAMKLSDREVDDLVKKESLRQQTWPVSVEARLNWIVAGLFLENKIIDIDKIVAAHLSVKKSDYQYWNEYITEAIPYIAVVGSGK